MAGAAVGSLAFDEYGRPFLILRDQNNQNRITGKDAIKVIAWYSSRWSQPFYTLRFYLTLIICDNEFSNRVTSKLQNLWHIRLEPHWDQKVLTNLWFHRIMM